jgi:hypothetical protein
VTELHISRRDLLDLEVTAAAASMDPTERGAVAATIASPDRALRLHIERPGERSAHDLWLAAEHVVHQVEIGVDEPAVATYGPAGLLPSIVARLVGLGHRLPAAGGRAVVGRIELADHLARGSDVPGLGAVVCVWTLQVLGAEHEGCTVLDQGASGPLWRLVARAEDGTLTFEHTTSLAVWALLGRLLRTPEGRSVGGERDLEDAELPAQ